MVLTTQNMPSSSSRGKDVDPPVHEFQDLGYENWKKKHHYSKP